MSDTIGGEAKLVDTGRGTVDLLQVLSDYLDDAFVAEQGACFVKLSSVTSVNLGQMQRHDQTQRSGAMQPLKPAPARWAIVVSGMGFGQIPLIAKGRNDALAGCRTLASMIPEHGGKEGVLS